MGDKTKRANAGVCRAACIAVGLLVGCSVGTGLAFAWDDHGDYDRLNQTLQREQAQAEQRNADHLATQQREAHQEVERQAQEFQRHADMNRSFSYTSPDRNGGRPVACSANAAGVYCP